MLFPLVKITAHEEQEQLNRATVAATSGSSEGETKALE